MADFVNNYSSAVRLNVTGGGIAIETYSHGVLVSTQYIPYGSGGDEIVGLIQAAFPDTYNTITSLVQLNDADVLDLRSNKGLRYLCANCSSLTTFNLSQVVLATTNPLYSNEYAFYGCGDLEVVLVGDGLDNSSSWYGTSMFQGCSSLVGIYDSYVNSDENVTATIDLTCGLFNFKDMFKGCSNLTGLKLKSNELMSPQIIDGVSYSHGYEYLGLQENQFEVVSIT